MSLWFIRGTELVNTADSQQTLREYRLSLEDNKVIVDVSAKSLLFLFKKCLPFFLSGISPRSRNYSSISAMLNGLIVLVSTSIKKLSNFTNISSVQPKKMM